MIQNKKSILGLNTVKAFIVVLLSLAIIGIVTLVVMSSLNTDSVRTAGALTVTTLITNETVTAVDSGVAKTLAYGTNPDYTNVVCTIISANNKTSAHLVNSTERTNTNCAIKSAGTYFYNNTDWYVTYTATYKDGSKVSGIANNVSSGISSFFGNAGTYFALLGVVVIILIISLVVVVVNRFGGEGENANTGGATM